MVGVGGWGVAGGGVTRGADSATDSQRPADPPLLVHIPHLLLGIAACRPCPARAEGAGAASGSLGRRTEHEETIARRLPRQAGKVRPFRNGRPRAAARRRHPPQPPTRMRPPPRRRSI